MQCSACHKSIESTMGGFIVCRYCGTVNVSEGTATNQNMVIGNMIVSPGPAKRTLLQMHKTWLISGVVITLILTAGTGFFYPFSKTVTKPSRSLVQSKQWHGDASKLQQARQLVAMGKLDEAISMLGRVEKDYPAYSKVTDLQKIIQEQKAIAAKKAADAQPKIDPPPPTRSPVSRKRPTVAPTPAFTTPIQIRGDATCQSSTLAALALLSKQAPTHYSTVTQYISIMECVAQGSGMLAYENPPRYLVGDATRNAGTVWYASTIAHDAGHSKLYHDYLASHPGQSVPGDVWTGESAERTCLEAQYNALTRIGGTQYQLDYVQNIINSQYYNVPYDQRWW